MITRHSFTTSFGITFPYLLYTPENAAPLMPLIVYLHGAGERGPADGSKVDLVAVNACGEELYNGSLSLPAYVVMPQCPPNAVWSDFVLPLREFVLHVTESVNADPDRVSLTGISMGGFGTWSLAIAFPELFSAIAPVCGGGLSWAAPGRLGKKPVWAFHGDADTSVPFQYSLLMVDALERAGGNVKLTVFHNVGHNCWNNAYRETTLLSWLIAQKR